MLEDKVIPLLGGVNRLTDPLRIGDTEAVQLKNLYPSKKGKLEKRAGAAPAWFWQTAASAAGLNADDTVPVNLFLPKFAPGAAIFVLQNTVSKEVIVNVGTIGENPAVFSVTKTIVPTAFGFVGQYRPAMIEYGKRVLIASGKATELGACVWIVSFGPGGIFQVTSSAVRFTDGSGNYVAPRCISVYQGRVVYSNFGPGFEGCMVFADPDDQFEKINALTDTIVDVSAAGGRALQLGGLRGDSIIVADEISVKSVGAPDSAAMLVLGSEKAIIMPGTPLLTDDIPAAGEFYSGTLSPQTVNYPCGCVSADTYVRTPMGVLWASWNDVWAIDIGGTPKRVGTKIRDVLTEGAATARYQWHAAYHHSTGSYRLAIVTGDQATDEEGGFQIPCKNQWWLDLRYGIPQSSGDARWYGPMVYKMQSQADEYPQFPGTFIMRTDEREGAPSKLYAAHLAYASAGTAASSSRLPVLVEMDGQMTRDSAVPVAPSIAGTIYTEILPSAQVGNEIVWEIITKEYDFDNPMVDKTFQSLDLNLWTSDVATIEATVTVDGGNDQHVMVAYVDQLGFIGSVDPLNLQRMTHQYQAIRLQPFDGARPTGKIFQFKIKDAKTYGSGALEDIVGVPVPENGVNSQILVTDKATAIVLTATVPSGHYTGIGIYADTLADAIEATNLIPSAVFRFQIDTTQPDTLPFEVFNSGFPGKWTWIMDFAIPVPNADSNDEAVKTRRRSRKVAAMLGFYENPEDDENEHDGLNNVADTISTQSELAGMQVRVYHFQRKPSGAKYEPNIP